MAKKSKSKKDKQKWREENKIYVKKQDKCKQKCKTKKRNKEISLNEYKKEMKKHYNKPLLKKIGLKYDEIEVEEDYKTLYIPWCVSRCMKYY